MLILVKNTGVAEPSNMLPITITVQRPRLWTASSTALLPVRILPRNPGRKLDLTCVTEFIVLIRSRPWRRSS